MAVLLLGPLVAVLRPGPLPAGLDPGLLAAVLAVLGLFACSVIVQLPRLMSPATQSKLPVF